MPVFQDMDRILCLHTSDFAKPLPVCCTFLQNLRDALDNLFDARVPKRWIRFSWQSSTIGFWFTELLERNAQFFSWVFQGRPNLFWMTGFFNPQGKFTPAGMLMELILMCFFHCLMSCKFNDFKRKVGHHTLTVTKRRGWVGFCYQPLWGLTDNTVACRE